MCTVLGNEIKWHAMTDNEANHLLGIKLFQKGWPAPKNCGSGVVPESFDLNWFNIVYTTR